MPIETALTDGARRASTTNTYGVDPNYRLGYVQIWNVDVQRDIARTCTVRHRLHRHERGEPRHPARAQPRTRTARCASRASSPFIWESSEGDSILQSMTVRLPQAADPRHRRGRAPTRCRSRSTMPRRSAAAARWSRRTIWISRRSAGFRASISGTASPATSPIELPFGANKRWFNDNGADGDRSSATGR